MSDHYDGRRYFNPAAPRYGFRAWRVLGWMMRRRPERWPRWIDDPVLQGPAALTPHQIAATFVGQSTFLLQLDGLNMRIAPAAPSSLPYHPVR